MSDRPIGCLLSGGLDSSLVSALVAKKLAPQRIHTFSIDMEGATDLKYARMVAEHINSIHHEVIVSQEDMINAIKLFITSKVGIMYYISDILFYIKTKNIENLSYFYLPTFLYHFRKIYGCCCTKTLCYNISSKI